MLRHRKPLYRLSEARTATGFATDLVFRWACERPGISHKARSVPMQAVNFLFTIKDLANEERCKIMHQKEEKSPYIPY
ncbi:hypothetical protein GCM10028810_04710 [Spirosoma litoris]